MREIDLKKLIGDLYISNKYYASIPIGDFSGYEDSYHNVTLDPDGLVRDLNKSEERTSKLRNFLSEYLSEIANLTPGRILDVGCGLGVLLSGIPNSWQKFGVEVSTFACSYASQFGKIYNVPIETFESNQQFDLITMHHVIEHIAQPCNAIKKIHNLLKDDGIFIIGTPDFDSAMARRYGAKFRLLHDPSHISLFSNDSMHRFLRDHGFDIYKVEYPYFETDYFNSESLLRVLSVDEVSPPFYGSVMTFFAKKRPPVRAF